MTYVSDIIKANLEFGLKPVLLPRKRLVMLFTCPECNKVKMTKYTQRGTRAKKSECPCGYIHYSPAWRHGISLKDATQVGLRVGSTTL